MNRGGRRKEPPGILDRSRMRASCVAVKGTREDAPQGTSRGPGAGLTAAVERRRSMVQGSRGGLLDPVHLEVLGGLHPCSSGPGSFPPSCLVAALCTPIGVSRPSPPSAAPGVLTGVLTQATTQGANAHLHVNVHAKTQRTRSRQRDARDDTFMSTGRLVFGWVVGGCVVWCVHGPSSSRAPQCPAGRPAGSREGPGGRRVKTKCFKV